MASEEGEMDRAYIANGVSWLVISFSTHKLRAIIFSGGQPESLPL